MAQPPGNGYQYGQQFQPPRKSRLGWILGGVGVATALIIALLFTGCTAAVSLLENGGSHDEDVRALIAKADLLPQSDWQLVERSDPKVDFGCVSDCVRLDATWSVPHKVGLADTAGRLGVHISGPPMGLFSGCMADDMKDGGHARVCIDPAPDLEDSWLVSINLSRK